MSIATIIGEAATRTGLALKQAEVHGMSQRGGDVQSNLRLSDTSIASDLIALGTADMIISLEPMEALRYLPYLSKDGWIITSSAHVILLGAAASFLKILDAATLRESVGRIFASKGEEVVNMNYRAFDIGHEYVKSLGL